MRRDAEAWLILFDDQGEPPELFVGEGSEKAARETFEKVSLNYNCHLFQKIESR